MASSDQNILILFTLTVVLAPLAAALCTFLFRRRTRILSGLTVGFALLSLIASVLVASTSRRAPLRFALFYLDDLSIYFMLLVNLVAFIASWHAIHFLESDARYNRHHDPVGFHLFFNLFHFTMLAVPMVDNLVVLWIAVELTTVVSTILVRYRRDRAALEAAWKFIIITTTGIIFALLGTLFLANAITNDTITLLDNLKLVADPMRWSVLARHDVAVTLNSNFVLLSFLFVLIGYGTKAGLAPMHTWLPDGHGEAPSPVSALLSGVMLKSALYAILRFYTITNLNRLALPECSSLSQSEQFACASRFSSSILLVAGLLSLVLATPFILKRNRFKRVLAYHSLEHMGIITFGIGIGTQIALFGALLHALNHALTKAFMFLTFGYIQDEYRQRAPDSLERDESEDQIRGVWKSMPVSGIILASGGLALVGSPPFNIFMSEFIILWAAIQRATGPDSGSSSIVMIAAITLFLISITLIFGGLVGHISRLLLDRPPFKPIEPALLSFVRLSPFLLLLGAIIVFGVLVPSVPVNFPALLKESARILAEGAPMP